MNHDNEQQPTEERTRNRYIRLVEPGDVAEKKTDDLEGEGICEVTIFPYKRIGSIGMGQLRLARTTGGYEDKSSRKVLSLTWDGLKEITYEEAQLQGLHDVQIEINNPDAVFRNQAYVYISLDGIHDVVGSELINETKEAEGLVGIVKTLRNEEIKGTLRNEEMLREGSRLQDSHWGPAEDIQYKGRYTRLVVPNDREFLESLFFRFEVLEPRRGEAS